MQALQNQGIVETRLVKGLLEYVDESTQDLVDGLGTSCVCYPLCGCVFLTRWNRALRLPSGSSEGAHSVELMMNVRASSLSHSLTKTRRTHYSQKRIALPESPSSRQSHFALARYEWRTVKDDVPLRRIGSKSS